MKTDRELFLYELDGHGYTFENMTWLGNCFEDNFLNMAWEMWCASASREGCKLVPVGKLMDCLYQISDRSYVDDNVSEIKAMIEAVEK